MATLYDEFIGSRGNLKYVEGASVEYPLPEDNTVLGTTFLPRVYGKDLQAFEIASTGYVAVTLDDVHSLDLARNSAESNVIMSTLCNDSFEINVNSSNVTVKADGQNNDLSFFAQRDINGHSDRSINLSADSNVKVVGQQDVDITASNNASFKAVNEMDLFSTTFSNNVSDDHSTHVGGSMFVTLSNDYVSSGVSMSNIFSETVTVQAGQNIALTGDNSAMMASQGRVEISGVENNMNIVMDEKNDVFRTHTNFDFFATASNEYRIQTSNDFIVIAQDNISLDSTTMSNVVGEDYNAEIGRDMIFNVTGDISSTSTTMSNVMSEDLIVQVGRDMTQYVEDTLDMTSTTLSNLVKEDYKTEVGRDIVVSASNNMSLTAVEGSLDVRVNEGAMAMTFDHTTDTIHLETTNNMVVGASNDMTATVGRDLSASITGDVDISATTMSNVLSGNYKTEVAGEMAVDVTGDMSLTNMNFSNVTQSNYNVDVVSGDMIFSVQQGTYNIDVNSGAMTMRMDSVTNDMSTHVDNDFIVSTSNDTFMDTKKNVMIRSKDDENDFMHFMEFQSDNQINFSTTGTYSFNIKNGIQGTPKAILTMDDDNVFVNANLNVSGVVNSTGIVENRLEIEDKTLYLATSSNFVDSLEGDKENIVYADDGIVNDGAGVRIHGIPSSVVIPEGQVQHDVAHLYEKSLVWNHRTTGVLGLGGDNHQDEARWEIKGGGLYLTNQRVNENGELVNRTSFGFRINKRDELELIKEVNSEGEGPNFSRRVAKFGFNL